MKFVITTDRLKTLIIDACTNMSRSFLVDSKRNTIIFSGGREPIEFNLQCTGKGFYAGKFIKNDWYELLHIVEQIKGKYIRAEFKKTVIDDMHEKPEIIIWIRIGCSKSV